LLLFQPSPVTLQLSGLSPWVSSDYVEINSITADFLNGNVNPSGIAAGGTTGQATVQWDGTGTSTQITSSDLLQFLQVRQASSSGVSYTAGVAVASVSGVTIGNGGGDGGSQTIPVAFTPPTTGTKHTLVNIGWKLSDYASQAASVHPSATPGWQTLSIQAQAAGASYGFGFGAAFLMTASEPPGTGDVTGFSPTYVDPFASATDVGWVSAQFNVYYQVAGSQVPVGTNMNYYDTAGALSGASIGVKLPPPGTPKIDGAAFGLDQTLTSLTPTLSWQAAGARDYTVAITQVSNAVSTPTASIATDQTSLEIPPGLLTSGQQYIFAIKATMRTGSYQTTPDRGGLPQADATTFSGLLTAP
jgi:hypothetical protein